MAEKSFIQWTDATWNPWHGCKKISDGCKYCYMYRDKEKYGQDPTKVVRSKTKFNDPLKWKEPMKVFTCSWSDFFIEEADEWRGEAIDIINNTPHLTYQILTKRPERIDIVIPYNVWLGVSVENGQNEKRLDILSTNGGDIHWMSAEPLLGSLRNYFPYIDWIVIGGESGNDTGKYRYRECKLEWIENIIELGKRNGIPIFVKQLGTHLSKKLNLKDRHGGDPNEWPEHLRIRQFPE